MMPRFTSTEPVACPAGSAFLTASPATDSRSSACGARLKIVSAARALRPRPMPGELRCPRGPGERTVRVHPPRDRRAPGLHDTPLWPSRFSPPQRNWTGRPTAADAGPVRRATEARARSAPCQFVRRPTRPARPSSLHFPAPASTRLAPGHRRKTVRRTHAPSCLEWVVRSGPAGSSVRGVR